MKITSKVPNLKNEIAAGISSAIVSLPLSLGVGLISTSFLSAEYSGLGILAGLYGFLIVTIVAPFSGASRFHLSSPSIATAGILSGLGSLIISHPDLSSLLKKDAAQLYSIALSFMFLCSALVGVIQILIAQLRLVTVIKVLPKTVFAGVLNAVGIIIIVSQTPRFLGMEAGAGLSDLILRGAPINIWDVIVGSTTATLIDIFPK